MRGLKFDRDGLWSFGKKDEGLKGGGCKKKRLQRFSA